MSFKKSFEAVPIELGEQDRSKQRAVLKLALFGILAGAGIGLAAVSLRNGDLSWLREIAPVSASPDQVEP